MGVDRKSAPSELDEAFIQQVGSKAARKLRGQREAKQGVWFGLGMSGLIGWSVAVPTVAGALFGAWWDSHHASGHSWTLMLLIIGLAGGCANAWHWVSQQDAAMQEKPEDQDD